MVVRKGEMDVMGEWEEQKNEDKKESVEFERKRCYGKCYGTRRALGRSNICVR